MELQLNTKLLTLQTDLGGEYRKLTSFLSQHGIIFAKAVLIPLNKMALWKESIDILSKQGTLCLPNLEPPFTYWTEAFSTAVHLINRLPTAVLQYTSPFEVLHHHKPDYTYLKIFGCLSYPHLRPFNSHKIQFRSSPCVFLGYSPRHKEYQCLHSSGKIYISRHVIFYETQFPFKDKTHTFYSSTSSTSKPSLFSPIPICQPDRGITFNTNPLISTSCSIPSNNTLDPLLHLDSISNSILPTSSLSLLLLDLLIPLISYCC